MFGTFRRFFLRVSRIVFGPVRSHLDIFRSLTRNLVANNLTRNFLAKGTRRKRLGDKGRENREECWHVFEMVTSLWSAVEAAPQTRSKITWSMSEKRCWCLFCLVLSCFTIAWTILVVFGFWFGSARATFSLLTYFKGASRSMLRQVYRCSYVCVVPLLLVKWRCLYARSVAVRRCLVP